MKLCHIIKRNFRRKKKLNLKFKKINYVFICNIRLIKLIRKIKFKTIFFLYWLILSMKKR